MRGPHAVRHGQQVQIVIAEQRLRSTAERSHALQHSQRLRPAIDQIAEHGEAVARG